MGLVSGGSLQQPSGTFPKQYRIVGTNTKTLLYRHMARKDRYLQIRVTDEQLEKLEEIAEEQGTDKAKLIREHIDQLPKPKKNS